jgi:hypothetical protein
VEDEVVVGRHQAERVHRPVAALDAAAEVPQEVQAVGAVAVDVTAGHAPRVDVEVAVRERGTKDAGHALDESGRPTERSRRWIDRRTLVAKALSVADVSRV